MTQPSQSPVGPGDVILGKYKVESVLGQGGMGVVVAARHLELGELFAIKFLLPAALLQGQAVERFVREARASARLKGEHVAKVQDVGRMPDGLPYMVMEHLAGKDLKETVKERGPLPAQEAATYVLQACEAVAEAHSLGIIHRDIKPANLFLTRRPNGSPCVKVLDFGISKQLDPENPDQHGLTKTGMLLGSPYYMSPEQMLRTKEADPRSDIWSLGCVLYELLTGHVPFQADALTELVGLVLQEEPKPPRSHRPDVTPAVEAVVLRCLVKKKEHRYQSVTELAEALRSAAWATSGDVALPAPHPPPDPRASTPAWAQSGGALAQSGGALAQSGGALAQSGGALAQSGGAPGALAQSGGGTLAGVPAGSAQATLPLAAPSPVAVVTGAAVAPQTTAPGWGTTAPEVAAPKNGVRTALLAGGAIGLVVLLAGGVFVGTRGDPSAAAGPPAQAATPAGTAAVTGEVAATAAESAQAAPAALAPEPAQPVDTATPDGSAEPLGMEKGKGISAPAPKDPKPPPEPGGKRDAPLGKAPLAATGKATAAPVDTATQKKRETMY